MSHRIFRHLRPRSAASLAIGVLVGAGGSFALAAGSARTITACADKGTGVLHLKSHVRCRSSQTRVSWNQVGPQGKQGPPGAPAVSIWGAEGFNQVPGPEHGLSIVRVSAGTYQVTITAPACAQSINNTPVVTIVGSNPPAGHTVGAFPVAWVTSAVSGRFTVYAGVVVGGTFTASDGQFNVYDTC